MCELLIGVKGIDILTYLHKANTRPDNLSHRSNHTSSFFVHLLQASMLSNEELRECLRRLGVEPTSSNHMRMFHQLKKRLQQLIKESSLQQSQPSHVAPAPPQQDPFSTVKQPTKQQQNSGKGGNPHRKASLLSRNLSREKLLP